ncbi:MAG: helix-turn-helix domain-containing protein [Ilumatobacteraceae bacterium]
MRGIGTPAATKQVRPGKDAILRAAVRVMGEQGYEGASTRDMAAAAGVSVAALYHHFPSKHDLLRSSSTRHGRSCWPVSTGDSERSHRPHLPGSARSWPP